MQQERLQEQLQQQQQQQEIEKVPHARAALLREKGYFLAFAASVFIIL